MTLTGMKKHVGVLEQAGLVSTEKVGRVRDEGKQPAVAVALLEVLVHDDAWQQAQAGRHLRHPQLGRAAFAPEGDHVLALDAGARRGACDYGAACVRGADGRAERGPRDDGGQRRLVAARHEDAGHVVELGDDRRVAGLPAGARPGGDHVRDAELGEDLAVGVDDLLAQR